MTAIELINKKHGTENLEPMTLTLDVEEIAELMNEFAQQQPNVVKSVCDICGCSPSVIITTEFGTFCKEHARYSFQTEL